MTYEKISTDGFNFPKVPGYTYALQPSNSITRNRPVAVLVKFEDEYVIEYAPANRAAIEALVARMVAAHQRWRKIGVPLTELPAVAGGQWTYKYYRLLRGRISPTLVNSQKRYSNLGSIDARLNRASVLRRAAKLVRKIERAQRFIAQDFDLAEFGGAERWQLTPNYDAFGLSVKIEKQGSYRSETVPLRRGAVRRKIRSMYGPERTAQTLSEQIWS